MDVGTILSKYEVVIPRSIRDRLKLEPGQEMQALLHQNRIEFIPVRSARRMRGFLRGIDTTVPRDDDGV